MPTIITEITARDLRKLGEALNGLSRTIGDILIEDDEDALRGISNLHIIDEWLVEAEEVEAALAPYWQREEDA